MKKNLIPTIASLLFAACGNNENAPADMTTDERVPVEFRASVSATRAIDQAWSATDAIGIFMVKADAALTPAAISEKAENIRYVADATAANAFKPATAAIYYPMDNSTVDFYTYYPQATTLTNEAETGHYLYVLNVATQTNQEALDFMVADAVKGKKKTDKSVALVFKHQLCKVILTVEPGKGVEASDLTNLTVKVNGQNTAAAFDLTTGTLRPASTPKTIGLLKTVAPDNGAITCEAILLPDATESRTFEFDLNNGHDAPFVWNMPKALVSGNKYAYTVKLNRTGVTVSGQIEAWGSGGSGTVDAN